MKYLTITMLFILTSCLGSGKSNNSNSDNSNNNSAPSSSRTAPAAPAAAKKWVQIERLARPGINEALVLDNDKLNAFNSIPPTFDLAVDNAAVLSVLQQAATALNLFDSLDGNDQFANDFSNKVVQGFLPDVMRINVAAPISVGMWAYNADAAVLTAPSDAAGGVILTGGRKIEDDVIDISLSYLVTANPGSPTVGSHGLTITDNVTYPGVPGNNAQGHKKLWKQSSYNGAAEFPFLAMPHK